MVLSFEVVGRRAVGAFAESGGRGGAVEGSRELAVLAGAGVGGGAEEFADVAPGGDGVRESVGLVGGHPEHDRRVHTDAEFVNAGNGGSVDLNRPAIR